MHASAKRSKRMEFCSFEVQTCIPGAEDHRRRTLDLLVFGPHAVLNVEIDGERHNRIKRREKDYDRDRLLSRHMRTLRFSHDRVLSDPGSVSKNPGGTDAGSTIVASTPVTEMMSSH